ncbi:hypothetical protein BV20DRAFT_861127 [Pilatotrama ljubarskyi]|nr:hypothetical protein BV20DRAFT_861127 [Pilatotrama ljubarskyi]
MMDRTDVGSAPMARNNAPSGRAKGVFGEGMVSPGQPPCSVSRRGELPSRFALEDMFMRSDSSSFARFRRDAEELLDAELSRSHEVFIGSSAEESAGSSMRIDQPGSFTAHARGSFGQTRRDEFRLRPAQRVLVLPSPYGLQVGAPVRTFSRSLLEEQPSPGADSGRSRMVSWKYNHKLQFEVRSFRFREL